MKKLSRRNIRIAIVGATGAVGKEILKIIQERGLTSDPPVLLASRRSAGTKLTFLGNSEEVHELFGESFKNVDIAIFSAGSDVSRVYALFAKNAGCVVIDNSSAFRMHKDVPLVIPEINAEDIGWHRGIISNPNCTTAITLMALWPLHKAFGVKRIIASSYQAVSGAGARGVRELGEQTIAWANDKMPTVDFFPHQIAFNVLPFIDSLMPSGYTREEEKMAGEGRKIMHHLAFKASVTCVRVPVFRAHSVSVSAEFEKPITADTATKILLAAPGIIVSDDPSCSRYPTPLQAAGQDECFVGRIREDTAFDNGLSFFVCGDQLRKGAALNAVQIAEHLVS